MENVLKQMATVSQEHTNMLIELNNKLSAILENQYKADNSINQKIDRILDVQQIQAEAIRKQGNMLEQQFNMLSSLMSRQR